MAKKLSITALILVLVLSACGTADTRDADVLPLQENVAEQPAVIGVEQALPAPEEGTANVAVEPVISFSINGGPIGFCDNIKIAVSGDYILNSCTQGQVTGKLKQSDRASLEAWVNNLAAFQMSGADAPNASDGFDINLEFMGHGTTEVDSEQKLVLYDWVNGLVASLQPRPEIDLSMGSVPVAENGLCADIPRPALVMLDFEQPEMVSVLNVDTLAACEVELAHVPFGRIIAAGQNIYYPVANSDAQTVTLWEFNADGAQAPLLFTQLHMEEPAPHGFVVSDDGARVAWSQTVLDYETDPPTYHNTLWTANIDGTQQVKLLDDVANDEQRFVTPIHFSPAGDVLFYAIQPDIGGPVFSGRLDNLYRVPASGGDAELIYACAAEQNPVCISGVAHDGSAFTALDPTTDAVQVLDASGAVLNTIPLPATDYVERTIFGPDSSLAFVSATFSEPLGEEAMPLPGPGYITMLVAPYTEPAQTILSNNNVGTLWGWIDDQRLVFGSIDTEGNTGTALVSLDGNVTEASPKFAAALLK